MHNLKFFIYLTLLAFCSVSCNQKKQYAYELVAAHDVAFPLDSVSTYKVPYMQYVNVSGTEYFSFLNTFNNSIYIYDFKTHQKKYVIPCETEGPNATGNIQSYWIHNLDTIFVLNHKKRNVFQIDNHGIIALAHTIGERENGIMPGLSTSSSSKLFYKGNQLYIPTFLIGGSNINVFATVDTKTGKVVYRFPYQNKDIYNENLLHPNYYELHFDFNEKNHKFFVGFAADSYIYETDLNDSTKAIEALIELSPEIDPYYDYTGLDNEKQKYLYYTSSFYKSVIYDTYRNIYYRVAEIGLSKEEYALNDPKKSFVKQFVVAIFDEHFNKIAETPMPRYKHIEFMFFVTPDGLYFGNESDNEDEMTFTLFQLKKKSDA